MHENRGLLACRWGVLKAWPLPLFQSLCRFPISCRCSTLYGCFFKLPFSEKQRALRKTGESYGYASSFTGRFSSKLPWKQTLSFRYAAEKKPRHQNCPGLYPKHNGWRFWTIHVQGVKRNKLLTTLFLFLCFC